MAAARARVADELLTLAEVGHVLGVSGVTVWRRVRAGALDAVDVGEGRPRLRVSRSALDDYIRQRKVVLPGNTPTQGRGRRRRSA